MVVYTVQAPKPEPNSKIGISFGAQPDSGKIVLTEVSDTSLFAGTALAAGHEILSINETSVTGMGNNFVSGILRSIPKVVTIKAKTTSSSLFHLAFQEKKTRVPDGNGGAYTQTRCEISSDRSTVPPLLLDMGVSKSKWARIVDAYVEELIPAVKKSTKMNQECTNELSSYTRKQMFKGSIGYGMESSHEQKVLNMFNHNSALANNCNLLAYNILALANGLLNTHGVLAQLSFSKKKMPRWSNSRQKEPEVMLVPDGIEFVSLAEEG